MSTTSIDASRPRAFDRKYLWRALTLIIAAIVIIFLIKIMDWQQFARSVQQLSPATIAAAVGVYLLLNLFRSMRYKALLAGRDVPLRWLYPIGLYHNFMVRILPFKLGELSYIMLLRNHLDISVEEGVSSLFGSRMLELLVIVLVGAISLLGAHEFFPGQQRLEVLFIVLVIVAGIPGLYFAGVLIRIAARVLNRIPLGFMPALCARLEKLAAQFDRLRQPGLFIRAFGWSLCTYSTSFAANWILLQSTGIQMDFAALVIVITMGMFASAFPFNISGFGMVEVSWTFGLTVLLGYSAGQAASVGLLLNGFQVLTSVIFGIIGWLILRVMTRNASPANLSPEAYSPAES